jgi:hypothetical protein
MQSLSFVIRRAMLLNSLLAILSLVAYADAASNPHGVQEFTANGTWTAPSGIKSVLVEMWGGGGGGDTTLIGPFGGSGAYSRSVIPVKLRKIYNVVVGSGGAPNQNGGDSQFLDPNNNILLFAGGGPFGQGAGGAEDANAMIHHPGIGLGVGGLSVGNSNPRVGFDGAGGVSGTLGPDGTGHPGYVLLLW